MRVWLSIFCVACTTSPVQDKTPGDLGDGDRFEAVDFDGDGTDEVVRFWRGAAYWGEHTADLGGGVQQALRADPDDDGQEVLYVASGRSRSHKDATARIHRIGKDGATLLWSNDDGRNRITDLQSGSKGLHMARFGVDKNINGAWIVDGRLEASTEAVMALRQVPLDNGRMALGRLYGDTPRSHGDLRIRAPGKPDTILPTVRGVRTLVKADFNNDGSADLLAADGWHYRYGSDAQARLTLYLGPDFQDRRSIAEMPGEYTINWIGIVPGSPPALVAAGNKHLHHLRPDTLGWKDEPLANINEGDHVTLWHAQGATFALISGQPGRVVPVPR